jgi:CRISPR-associated protein Csx17
MRHLHELGGCAPTPIAHYLKALAILRLVAEQADPSARGFWRGASFCLVTTLDRDALVRFFVAAYAPTPMLSPWNGGSGFYPRDSQAGIGALQHATAERFAGLRAAIVQTRGLVGERTESPKDEAKFELQLRCAAEWPESVLPWLGAVVSPQADAKPEYPALLGTGGNDGRLDFTNNYMQRLTELFDAVTGAARPGTEALLEEALFRSPTAGLGGTSIGQYSPGSAGGANATAGFDADPLVNPWELVLTLEGIMLLRVASVRRLDSADSVQASAPFAFRAVNEGYGSACAGDSSARGEQWMPLWNRPATLAEVTLLFAEARTRSGKKNAQNALDAAKAVARLGTARGVSSFVRYAYLERNGQANLAVPIGNIRVSARPEVRLLDEVDGFLRALRGAAGAKNASAGMGRAARTLESACLRAALPSATREDWLGVLSAVAAAEDFLLRQPKKTAADGLSPCRALSAEWLRLVDDGSVEMELAIAIASQSSAVAEFGPIRRNMLPLAARGGKFAVIGDGLATDHSVVWTGRDVVDDLADVGFRRCVDGVAAGSPVLPLRAHSTASLDASSRFLEGAVDDARLGRAIRALATIDFAKAPERHPSRGEASPLLAIVKLAYLTTKLDGLPPPPLDARPLRLLRAGRLDEAAELLQRRLAAWGLRPRFRLAVADARFARRLAACVAIPLSAHDLGVLRRRISVHSKPQGVFS